MRTSETKDVLLIVDDEEDIRLNLCDFMELEGFEVLQAANGSAALEVLENHTPEAIITDLMMAEMGGMELLEEVFKRNLDIPVVIMTAFGTIDYAVKAMKVGAADFITKPIDYDYMLRVVKRVLNAAQLERKVKQQQQQMDADLRLAAKIQKAILPKPIDTPRLSFNFRFEPMIQIGGDCLTVHMYDEDHIAVALFDVSGHGVAAALVANLVHNELRTRLREERPPFNVVEHIHRFVLKTLGKAEMFLTLVIAEIDLVTETLTVSNAGHPDLLLWKQESGSLESITSHVPVIGFPIKMTGDQTESKVTLAAGDRIILYTDGFPETLGQDGKMLGRDRFKQFVEQNIRIRAVDFLDEVFKAIDAFGADEPEDDRTLALVEIK